MRDNRRAAILMATYNGEKYLREQIESILWQTHKEWDLFIRDDDSTDSTVSIIQEYVKKDKRIHLISTESDKHGACINFYCLLRYAQKKLLDYSYFFLSDQDDIWEQNKIEEQIDCICRNEKENGKILVYSDLTLMDEDGKCSGKKMSDVQNINLVNSPDIFFNQIFVWGNTIAISKSLMNIINIPQNIDNSLSHDHYIAFYGVAFGRTIYMNKPLVRYRRHKDNLSGLPPKYNFRKIVKKVALGLNTIIRGHIQNYKNVLYFIENAPKKTKLMREVGFAIKRGGFYSQKVFRKYNIKPGSNRNNILANKTILLLKLHKMKRYKDEYNGKSEIYSSSSDL